MFGRSRLRSIAGGDFENLTLTAATTTNVPDSSNVFLISGNGVTITSLTASTSTRGRIVFFIKTGTGTVTFTNDDTPGAGEMDLGGSNRALDATDVLCLYLRTDGSWLRLFSTLDNT